MRIISTVTPNRVSDIMDNSLVCRRLAASLFEQSMKIGGEGYFHMLNATRGGAFFKECSFGG